jgi:hypothetical protein
MKYLRNIIIGALALLAMPTMVLGSGFLSNNYGDFYISEGVVYFRGTVAGVTSTEFQPLTGSDRIVATSESSLSGTIQDLYVDNEGIAVLTDRGSVFKLGVGSESIFGGSAGTETTWRYAAGSIMARVVGVEHTPGVGVVYQYADGTRTLTNADSDSQQYGAYINSEPIEKIVRTSSQELAVMESGNLYVGNSNSDMNPVSLSGEYVKDIGIVGSTTMVALTQSGVLYTSTDGINWAVSNSGVDNFNTSNGKIYIVKTDGQVLSSDELVPVNYVVVGQVDESSLVTSIQETTDGVVAYVGNDLYSLSPDGSMEHYYTIMPTYDANGFDLFGIHRDTGTEFDPNGMTVDGDAYDSLGYDMNGYDVDGYNASGWSANSINRETGTEFDIDGLTIDGDAYDSRGFDINGLSANGVNEAGFDVVTYVHRDTGTEFDPNGLTIDGDIYDQYGYDVGGYNAAGFNRDGIHIATGTEFDESGVSSDGDLYDAEGYDTAGYDASGYDRSGYDASGINSDGFYATGIHSVTGTEFDDSGVSADGDEFDSNGLTMAGSVFGSDNLTVDDESYGPDGRDYQGYDEGGFLADKTHRNGTVYDDDGYTADGWNEDGVFRDGATVRNGHLTKQFKIDHQVPRESYFKTQVVTAQINPSGQPVMLGTFIVRNNSRDGFELSLASAQGGILKPDSVLDGEVPIPYSVDIKQTGSLGQGVDSVLAHASDALSNGQVSILSRAGSIVSSATNATFEMYVNTNAMGGALDMAGTYSDVLTLTYTDI